MAIALNLWITFGKMAILPMLILPIHEYGGIFPTYDIFFNFFLLQELEVLVIQVFHMFG